MKFADLNKLLKENLAKHNNITLQSENTWTKA